MNYCIDVQEIITKRVICNSTDPELAIHIIHDKYDRGEINMFKDNTVQVSFNVVALTNRQESEFVNDDINTNEDQSTINKGESCQVKIGDLVTLMMPLSIRPQKYIVINANSVNITLKTEAIDPSGGEITLSLDYFFIYRDRGIDYQRHSN